ncbi:MULTISPECIES: flagellar basal body-associated FliL family protein [Clostridium]|uniref:flagellar basal body-associated FliL family protein n=1 Tax=Clostridium TaxID=1485 RepID=UPI0008240EAC|nr:MULTISPECIES: flagellar basal body-associated protein FliL [Clostridium]PJI09875.1 flagellar basal body protein FliL [Clostridium sp. CT7]
MSEKNKKGTNDNKEKSKLTIILLAIIVVLVVAFAAYFLFFSKKANQPQPVSNNNAVSNAQQVNADEKTYTFDEILTNLADTDSAKYVKVTVALGYNAKNSKLQSELEDKKSDIKTPILRDAIVDVLRSKKAADFNQEGIDKMKEQMLKSINPHLKNGTIDNVYFSDLVIQQ